VKLLVWVLMLLALGSRPSAQAGLTAQLLAGPLESVARGAAEAAEPAAGTAIEAALDPDEVLEDGAGRFSRPIEIALLLTLLSLIPAALISLTCFTRIVIVLSFVRRSLSINELPPNPILIGLALFLTTFVMAPVGKRIYAEAYAPYKAQEIGGEQALEAAWGTLRGFLLANTREGELRLFAEMAKVEPAADGRALAPEDLPFQVVVPAFVLSELKTAFQMGFLLFLPFLVIDLVIASVLISMGMFMLPPVMISTPFKILLFILVDGWALVCESLVTSFVVG
jgi:flagellar biosynthetic protein FliP